MAIKASILTGLDVYDGVVIPHVVEKGNKKIVIVIFGKLRGGMFKSISGKAYTWETFPDDMWPCEKPTKEYFISVWEKDYKGARFHYYDSLMREIQQLVAD